MTACCHCLLCSNSITKEDDNTLSLFPSFLTQKESNGSKLPLPFLLEHHQKKKAMTTSCHRLFVAITLQKKTTTHCHCLLLLKDKKNKHTRNQQKKYQKKGGSLPSSFRFAL